MQRCLEKELLDELAPEDARAIRSRRDLRRLNFFMGNAGILARALDGLCPHDVPLRIAEAGAGDGEVLLRAARRLRGRWPRVEAVLVDRQELLKRETRAWFAALNWFVQGNRSDAFAWLQQIESQSLDALVANLFLHHFNNEQLQEFFSEAARTARVFIAIEPRRARWPLLCARFLPLIGCGPVTRHDAPISIRAGFNHRELTALWPDAPNWELAEGSVGWFGHLFLARRKRQVDSALFHTIVASVFERAAAKLRPQAPAPGRPRSSGESGAGPAPPSQA
jgi:hypothetical protein